MTDFKEKFRQSIKEKTEGLAVSVNPSSLFNSLSEEYITEIESNPISNFRNKLHNTSKAKLEETKTFLIPEFNNIDVIPVIEEQSIEFSPITEEFFDVSPVNNLITATTNIITKEELNKPVKEHTDLFNQPNSKLTDPNIKSIQNKLKHLEDWVSKISMTGPGSGEVNFRWLDDVDRNTIGDTDQILRYNPVDNKFFFGQLSGDQGPVKSLQFDVNGAGITESPQMLSWNSSKDCLNIHQDDGSTLQVGLENYIRVHNSTANTLTNGTVVMFSGVNGDGETPTCVPLIANSSAVPLYTIGMLTNDIPSGTNGRATTLGEVRNINTTGSDVGETWVNGDLLWANPSNPGKLTKIKPTAPNVVISVAAVIKVGITDGILLVRPTLFPRLYYGSFFDKTDQAATVNTLNVPIAVKYSNTQISSGFHVANTTQIVAEHAGLYNYQFSIQVDSTNAGSAQNIWIWYRKNGNDVPSTASKISVNKEYKVIAWNFIESMQINDYFELMWATDSIDVKIVAPPATAFCPDIPSVLLTVTQINL